MIFLILQAPYI